MAYKRKWIPVSEAMRYIQAALDCTVAEAIEELRAALLDGEVKSRRLDTGKPIDPIAWHAQATILANGTVEVPAWWTMGKEAPACVRESVWEEIINDVVEMDVEVCREDMTPHWGPSLTAAQRNNAGSPIDPASSHCLSAEPCRDMVRSTPPAIKASNEPTAWKPRKRGPPAEKREAVERLILEDLRSGYTTLKKLGSETTKKEIYFRYRDIPGFEVPVSRDVVTRALLKILEGGPVS